MHGRIFVINGEDYVDEDYLFDNKEDSCIDYIAQSEFADDIDELKESDYYKIDDNNELTFNIPAIEKLFMNKYAELCIFIQTELSNPKDFAENFWKLKYDIDFMRDFKFYYDGCLFDELDFLTTIYRDFKRDKKEKLIITNTFDYHY